jgi:hypothetical protein
MKDFYFSRLFCLDPAFPTTKNKREHIPVRIEDVYIDYDLTGSAKQ